MKNKIVICVLTVFCLMFFVKEQSFASKCGANYGPPTIFDNTDITVSIVSPIKDHAYDVFVKNYNGVVLKHGKTIVDTTTNDLRFSISALSPGIYYLGAVDLSSSELCFNPEAKILVNNTTGTKNSTCLANIEGFDPTSIPVFNIGNSPYLIAAGSAIDVKQQYKIHISDTSSIGDYTYNGSFTIRNEQPFPKLIAQLPLIKDDGSPLANGTHIVTLSDSQSNALCSTQFAIGTIGAINQIAQPTSPPPPCATLAPDGKCINVNTAIGLISTEPASFVQSIFSIVLGLAGGIALILIMISGYRMMASQGNPEALTAARDQLISTIIGLLFIIFSFVILQVIGVDILKIPGFQP